MVQSSSITPLKDKGSKTVGSHLKMIVSFYDICIFFLLLPTRSVLYLRVEVFFVSICFDYNKVLLLSMLLLLLLFAYCLVTQISRPACNWNFTCPACNWNFTCRACKIRIKCPACNSNFTCPACNLNFTCRACNSNFTCPAFNSNFTCPACNSNFTDAA